MPGLVNFLAQTPVLGRLVKFAGGIAPQRRRCRRFAPETFKRVVPRPDSAERRQRRR